MKPPPPTAPEWTITRRGRPTPLAWVKATSEADAIRRYLHTYPLARASRDQLTATKTPQRG